MPAEKVIAQDKINYQWIGSLSASVEMIDEAFIKDNNIITYQVILDLNQSLAYQVEGILHLKLLELESKPTQYPTAVSIPFNATRKEETLFFEEDSAINGQLSFDEWQDGSTILVGKLTFKNLHISGGTMLEMRDNNILLSGQ